MSKRYLVIFKLNFDEYSMLVDENEFNKIMKWHDSEEQEYIIKSKSGYLHIKKSYLIELTYEELPIYRYLARPILYILKSPADFRFKVYVQIIAVIFAVIIGCNYLNGIPLYKAIAANCINSSDFIKVKNILDGLIFLIYIISFIKKFIEMRYIYDETLYYKAISFSVIDSYLVNGLMIMILSLFMAHIIQVWTIC